MFTPKLNTTRARYQNIGTPGSGNQSRKRSSIYTTQKKAFTPSSAIKNQSFNSSILQSSRVYEECGQHRVESYGHSLPILVTEALALKDKHVEPSVKISPTGWAWMVCGRRLIAWMYRSTVVGKTPPCHELSLPPSSLVHKANLITVLPQPNEPTTAGCLAITPEGTIRYWSNVAHEGSFVEISSEVKGEECASVMPIQGQSCIVATTTSSLMMVSPVPGQNALRCRVLRPPQGMLKGISRRMSSLIFGSISSQTLGANFHQMLPGEMLDPQTSALYVLCGGYLQKWAVTTDMEKMLYQCHVEQFVRDCFSHEIWHEDSANLPNLRTWLLDMQMTRDGVVVLAAGVNPDVSQEVYYSIGMLHTEGIDSPRSFLSFTIVRYTSQYSEDEENHVLGYRMLLPDPNNANVYLYEKRTLLCASVASSQHHVDKLEFYAAGDKILGAGQCDKTALIFSSTRGFVSVKIIAPQIEASMSESMMETATPTGRMDIVSNVKTAIAGAATPQKIEELSMSNDQISRLKAAFLHSCRRSVTQAQSIIDSLFPPDIPVTDEPGSNLDRLITKLSQEMIDDFPASDPRWAESHNSVGSSVSLILIHQLEDKLQAHEYLVQFLKSVGLWDRLSRMPVRNTIMQTTSLLCEHAEKLVAARTLRELHTQHPALVDQAISVVLRKRDELVPSSGLTMADVFYREVSCVPDIMEALLEVEEQSLSGDLSPRETVTLINTVNSIIGGMLTDAVHYRQSKTELFQSTSRVPMRDLQYLPWTASDGPSGARGLLSKQHHFTVARSLPEAQDSQERGAIFQQLLELTSLFLDGYKSQLDTIKMSNDQPTKQYRELLHSYEQERRNLISPFVKHKQHERAASLAEKYQDFPTLVQVCEETENQERLQRYMNQFQSAGFADFVFRWYMDEGKRGKLMTSSLANHPQLSRFLQTGENRYMSWLHDINSNNFLCAHKTLFDLGIDEKNSAAKKKTLLSLSKLAALATEDAPDVVHNNLDAIAEEQDLLLHQEQLPSEVLENLGLSPDNLKVYDPKSLVELYIGDFNIHANEFDFKKALDLLNYIDKKDPNYSSLLIQIWSRAIMKDDWSSIPADDHLENCRDTVFFKTVELAHSTGQNLRNDLPSADSILASEYLGDMKEDANFQFLIKACFEQIHRVLKL